jgi:hypothetical protein
LSRSTTPRVKVSDKEMEELAVRHHDAQPARNYTISPR